METVDLINLVQAVGLPASFAFALLWIVERRLSVIAEKIERILALLEQTTGNMARIVEKLGKEE